MHVDVLRPLYVSDHLCRFQVRGVRLSIPLEANYVDRASIRRRVEQYQEAIGGQLLLENYASTERHGTDQQEVLAWLVEATGCGLLFDISNARAAELNGVARVSGWTQLLAGRSVHCHVGSFRWRGDTHRYHDTHDQPVAASVLADVTELTRLDVIKTLCYERDHSIDEASLVSDLERLEAACA